MRVASAVVLMATGGLLIVTSSTARIVFARHVDPELRRRRLGRMLIGAGLWQWSIAVLLIVMGQWTNTIALFGVGLMLMALGRWDRWIGGDFRA